MSKIDKAFSEYIKQIKKDYPQEMIDKTAAKADFRAGYEALQKEYEEKFRWIPVEEKLPNRFSAILAVIKSPNQTWVEEIGFGETKFMLPGRGETDFVTHWMQVPEPPSSL